jgi:hypothetical protein
MKIKDFINDWKAGKLPVSTKNNITLSEGYRAYWEMKQEMWRRTKFNPLKK